MRRFIAVCKICRRTILKVDGRREEFLLGNYKIVMAKEGIRASHQDGREGERGGKEVKTKGGEEDRGESMPDVRYSKSNIISSATEHTV